MILWIKIKKKLISYLKVKIKLPLLSNIQLLNVHIMTDLIAFKVSLKCTPKKICVQSFFLKLNLKSQILQCNLVSKLHFYKEICPRKKDNIILMLSETEREEFLSLLMSLQEDLILIMLDQSFNSNLQETLNLLFIELDVLAELEKKAFVSHFLIEKNTCKVWSEFKNKQK